MFFLPSTFKRGQFLAATSLRNALRSIITVRDAAIAIAIASLAEVHRLTFGFVAIVTSPFQGHFVTTVVGAFSLTDCEGGIACLIAVSMF